MNATWSLPAAALRAFRAVRAGARAAPLCAVLLALAACNGTAVVTLTSTASQDNFLAYRVGLVSVQLQTSNGKSALTVLPASTTVDFATLTDVSEILGAAAVSKGSYKSALITLDFGSAQIVYDDGSVNGIQLTPVGANGRALGQVVLTVSLDPSDSFTVSPRGASRLALDFNMGASNLVDLSVNTVTVTPFMAASAADIDGKQVRIRGPLANVTNINTSALSTSFTMRAMPFNGTAGGAGHLAITPTGATTYEINGVESTGSAGLGRLAGLGVGTLAVAYGTLAAADQTTTTTSAYGTQSNSVSTGLSFTATQILAGGSVEGAGRDRISGVVSSRSGNTLTVEDATRVAVDGSESFSVGTTFVVLGSGTSITVFGQGGTATNGVQQVSVGSSIDAFGVITSQSSDTATLDASAGHIRLESTRASGLVTVTASGLLDLNLKFLGGRKVAPLDFLGSGAVADAYVVNTGGLDLSNATVGAPVIVTGFTGSFGAASPNFTASALLDPTTIAAQLIVDWGTGTTAPFTTYNGSSIEINIANGSIGQRHSVTMGAQSTDLLGLASDPSIVPDATSSNTVFTIGHGASSTMDSYNTYAAFIAQLQSELNGSVLVTGVTADGQYTASTLTLSATHITVFLND
jgi:hypothetical protein